MTAIAARAAAAARTAAPWLTKLLAAAGVIGTGLAAKDAWDEGNLIDAPEWTKAGKRNKIRNAGIRGMADEAVMDAGAMLPEEGLQRNLAGLAGLATTPRAPATYLAARDARFMAELNMRFRSQLQAASIGGGPTIAELAAKTGIL